MLNITPHPGNVTGDGTSLCQAMTKLDKRHVVGESFLPLAGCLDAPSEINTGATQHRGGFSFREDNGQVRRVEPFQAQRLVPRDGWVAQ